ncbi:beta strand repeat-containing protein [Bosea sp. MMO-172]|uniref:beta strand repeat-containing protein n=1 Tax=Bosea sp. MMO-172 TaxID=3127885 RepID=UPI00301A1A94
MSKPLSRNALLMSGTAALALLAAATAVTAADISATGHQNLINEQMVSSPAIHALIDNSGAGGVIVNGGSLLSSDARITAGDRRATAIGNTGQQMMTIERNAIDVVQPTTSGEYPYYEVVGPVAYTADGSVFVNGAFNIASTQTLGVGSILAEGILPVLTVGVADDVLDAMIGVDANAFAATALGNDVSNSLALKATHIATVAGINNHQMSEAGTDARFGTAAAPGGAVVTIGGSLSNGRVSILNNTVEAMTVGNRASNELAVETATLVHGGTGYGATAGELTEGIGASGTFVIANMQRFDVGGRDGVAGPGMSATADGRYAFSVGTSLSDAAVSIDRNSQTARIFGNAATNALTVSAATIDGGYEIPYVATALSSSQTASGDLKAQSHLGLVTPAIANRATLSVSGNENGAVARMNDVGNTLVIEAATIAGGVYAGVWGGAAYGDHVIFNDQSASGSVDALAESSLGGTANAGAIEASTYILNSNRTASEATANRTANDLTVKSAGALGAGVTLGNHQSNQATVQSSSITVLNLASGGALGSSITVGGNTATALARGNAVENRMTISSGIGAGGEGSPDVPMLMSASYSTPATAMLSNVQDNQGSVTARTIGSGSQIALNCDCTDSTRLGVAGNSANAAAYGNTALNAASVSGGAAPHLVMVNNRQTNNGAVTATVVDATPAIATAGLHTGNLLIGGNAAAAMAIGNHALNSIGTR